MTYEVNGGNEAMRLDWDPRKDATHQRKHGIGFEEASGLFTSAVEYLEIFDDTHSVGGFKPFENAAEKPVEKCTTQYFTWP